MFESSIRTPLTEAEENKLKEQVAAAKDRLQAEKVQKAYGLYLRSCPAFSGESEKDKERLAGYVVESFVVNRDEKNNASERYKDIRKTLNGLPKGDRNKVQAALRDPETKKWYDYHKLADETNGEGGRVRFHQYTPIARANQALRRFEKDGINNVSKESKAHNEVAAKALLEKDFEDDNKHKFLTLPFVGNENTEELNQKIARLNAGIEGLQKIAAALREVPASESLRREYEDQREFIKKQSAELRAYALQQGSFFKYFHSNDFEQFSAIFKKTDQHFNDCIKNTNQFLSDHKKIGAPVVSLEISGEGYVSIYSNGKKSHVLGADRTPRKYSNEALLEALKSYQDEMAKKDPPGFKWVTGGPKKYYFHEPSLFGLSSSYSEAERDHFLAILNQKQNKFDAKKENPHLAGQAKKGDDSGVAAASDITPPAWKNRDSISVPQNSGNNSGAKDGSNSSPLSPAA